MFYLFIIIMFYKQRSNGLLNYCSQITKSRTQFGQLIWPFHSKRQWWKCLFPKARGADVDRSFFAKGRINTKIVEKSARRSLELRSTTFNNCHGDYLLLRALYSPYQKNHNLQLLILPCHSYTPTKQFLSVFSASICFPEKLQFHCKLEFTN